MKHVAALCLLAVPVGLARADVTLKEARTSLLRGYYAEAREQYIELARNPKDRTAAAVGLSRALQSAGEYDRALTVAEAALKEAPKDADLLARRAEVLFLRGRWEEAERSARAALSANENQFNARWVLGQLLRDRGDWGKADEEFRWFIRTYAARDNDDRPITDSEELHLVGLAALERARFHHLDDQYQFVLTEVFGATVKKDKDFWPAEYEAGKLALEKHNKAAAFRALERALTINNRAAEVLVAQGQLALAGFEMQQAENLAERALKINSRLISALCLRADVYWFAGETAAALKDLEKARTVNPRDEQTLGRLAACYFAQKKDDRLQALIKRVLVQNPKPYQFYAVLAERCEERKFYDEAERYYKLASAARPELPDGLTGLGMLYMRLGREAEALKLLDQSFKADTFNVRVSNSLKVLEHLSKYETLKTEHFVLRYDAKNDAILARYVARQLEDIYKELAAKFAYAPKGPILIEIFKKHEMFSGRIVALPDLHTIGACTGPIFAMVSTHDTSKVIGKPFNWNRVIRHEMVHVFNLEQTKYQVPHWLTEGLAVAYEGPRTPPSWNVLLADKVRAGDLLNLDTILLGFVRPRSPLQWQQAYLQSHLYVVYLTQTHGKDSVGKLLAAFADGLDTNAALPKALGVTKEAFEKGYRAFLEERIKKIAVPPVEKRMTLRALRMAHEKNPDDVDLSARLAERELQLGRKKEAGALADAVLAVKNNHPRAATVKARLLLAEGDQDLALSLLEAAAKMADQTRDTRPLKLLGKLQMQAKKYEQAAQTFERGRALEPNEPSWLGELAKAYTKTEQRDKLLEVYREVATMDPDDPLPRRRLARAAADAGNHAEAERYARMVMEIDVRDAESQQILLQALEAQNKNAEAAELRKVFGR